MANTIIGKIQSIGQTVNVSKKEKAFLKRELVLNASRYDQYNGEERKNILLLTFAQKNCEKLDAFKVGDFVEVSFVLQGREYTARDNNQTKIITDVVAYDIALYQKQGSTSAPAAPRAPQAPQAPAPAPAPTTQAPAAQNNETGDLPF